MAVEHLEITIVGRKMCAATFLKTKYLSRQCFAQRVQYGGLFSKWITESTLFLGGHLDFGGSTKFALPSTTHLLQEQNCLASNCWYGDGWLFAFGPEEVQEWEALLALLNNESLVCVLEKWKRLYSTLTGLHEKLYIEGKEDQRSKVWKLWVV